MDTDNFMKLCRDYKELILEVVDCQFRPPAQFSQSPWSQNYKEVEIKGLEEEAVGNERIRSIDKDFQDVVTKFQNSNQPFCGYDWGGGHLVKTYYDVWNWIESIKRAKGLEHGLDITNAILQEMKKQELEKGLTTTPQAEDKTAQETIRLRIDGRGRDIVFDGRPYPLPETPYKFLYALVNTPGKTVPNDILLDLTPRGVTKEKNISKHIRTITDRIKPLLPFIKNKPAVGYYLDLPQEAVLIGPRDVDIDRILK